jgi:hypothetical protein
MNAVAKIRQKLASYPEVRHVATDSSVVIEPFEDSGFSVGLEQHRRGYTVSFEGWHEEFASSEEALDCFAFGLSEACRLRVTYRGHTAVKWAVQAGEAGEWIEDSEVGLLFVPFWRQRRVVVLQNHLLPPSSRRRLDHEVRHWRMVRWGRC